MRTSKRRTRSCGLILTFAVAAVLGCGSSDGDAGDTTPPPLNMSEEELNQPGETEVEASSDNIAQLTQAFTLPGPIAPTQRWTMRNNGLCGQTCRNGPRHMYSTAFGSTLLVSWMSVDPEDPWRQYGNVATFTEEADGTFTLKKNVSFDGLCEATYGISTNSEGSIIGVLCRGVEGVTEPFGEATNLLGGRREADCDNEWEGGCYPIGNYSSIDSSLYLLEYRSGSVTDKPDDVVYINHAVGGWRYGHHELMLNASADTYFVHLKVTAGPSEDNRHEGMTRMGIRRGAEFSYLSMNDQWGCGAGHVTTNRMAYNQDGDSWAQVCQLDACPLPSQYVNGRCDSISFSTISNEDQSTLRYDGSEYLLELDVREKDAGGRNQWEATGGVTSILSLGVDGWLALATGPGLPSTSAKPDTIGTIRLPQNLSDVPSLAQTSSVPLYESGTEMGTQEATRYPWNWLYLPAQEGEREDRAGMANMAYFDASGEQSQRLLVGWSPNVAFQGITDEYVVSEMDREGRLRGEAFRLSGAGWGEDNRWQTMPNTGCVVFPFAWVGDAPGSDYPHEKNESAATDYPTTLRLTSLCPKGTDAPALTPTPEPVADDVRWP